MAGGQEIDPLPRVRPLDLAELRAHARTQTSALIRAAVRLGADCGQPVSADENDALHRYASAIGLAFQVVDDVLDVEGTAQSLGKTAGKDAVQRKSTYVTLMGLAAARERIETLHVAARTALTGFGTGARRLLDGGKLSSGRTPRIERTFFLSRPAGGGLIHEGLSMSANYANSS
jgi:farnesyl diphosphate synthase